MPATHCSILPAGRDPSLPAGSFHVVSAFNILQFIREEDPLLLRIRELLKPGGVLIAAVDCYPERKTPLTLLTLFLSMMGIFPFIRQWKLNELKEAFRRNGFDVLETVKICDSPVVSYFAACRSREP